MGLYWQTRIMMMAIKKPVPSLPFRPNSNEIPRRERVSSSIIRGQWMQLDRYFNWIRKLSKGGGDKTVGALSFGKMGRLRCMTSSWSGHWLIESWLTTSGAMTLIDDSNPVFLVLAGSVSGWVPSSSKRKIMKNDESFPSEEGTTPCKNCAKKKTNQAMQPLVSFCITISMNRRTCDKGGELNPIHVAMTKDYSKLGA